MDQALFSTPFVPQRSYLCSQCSMRSICLPVGMTRDELECIDGRMVSGRQKLVRGERLFQVGDRFESVFAVWTGHFKTSVASKDGREQVTGFQMAGDLVGLDGIGTNRHEVDAVALDDSQVCIIPYAQLEQLALEASDSRVDARATSLSWGDLTWRPLNAEIDPRSVMTGWVTGETMPENWALGDSAQMRDVTGDGAVVKVDRHELQGDEVRGHLDTGMQVERRIVEIGNHVSMVACEDLVIRKFKLLDGALEKLESTEREDLRAEMDARFALFVGEFRLVFGGLEQAFQLSVVKGE